MSFEEDGPQRPRNITASFFFSIPTCSAEAFDTTLGTRPESSIFSSSVGTVLQGIVCRGTHRTERK